MKNLQIISFEVVFFLKHSVFTNEICLWKELKEYSDKIFWPKGSSWKHRRFIIDKFSYYSQSLNSFQRTNYENESFVGFET